MVSGIRDHGLGAGWSSGIFGKEADIGSTLNALMALVINTIAWRRSLEFTIMADDSNNSPLPRDNFVKRIRIEFFHVL